jgi:predicted transposase YbfD/YdcC
VGCIFTGDAAFCQRDFCEKVIDGGDYVLFAKDNQPSLVGDVAAGLAFEAEQRRQAAAVFPYEEVPPPPGSVAYSIDKGHGRIEKRTIPLTTVLTKTQQFKGLRQGFELTRERTEKGKTTVEVIHGISSLSRERADAHRLLELTRSHWGIENGAHYRRDVTLGEDQSRVRKGSAPEVLAGLRNSIIHLVQEVASDLATAIRRLGNRLPHVLELLGLPQLGYENSPGFSPLFIRLPNNMLQCRSLSWKIKLSVNNCLSTPGAEVRHCPSRGVGTLGPVARCGRQVAHRPDNNRPWRGKRQGQFVGTLACSLSLAASPEGE